MASHASSNNKSYMSYTRQASNFVFPFISQTVNGENRPRPNKFRISERDAEKLLQGKANLKQDKATEKFTNVVTYINWMTSFFGKIQSPICVKIGSCKITHFFRN